MTLDELIAWVSEQAAGRVQDARFACSEEDDALFLEEAATLTSVENALRRLREIERAHGGEA